MKYCNSCGAISGDLVKYCDTCGIAFMGDDNKSQYGVIKKLSYDMNTIIRRKLIVTITTSKYAKS